MAKSAVKHPVPVRVKPSFVICDDIRALSRSALIVRVPGCQKLQILAYFVYQPKAGLTQVN